MSNTDNLKKQIDILKSRLKKTVYFSSLVLLLFFSFFCLILFIRTKSHETNKYPLLDQSVGLINRNDLITNTQPIKNFLMDLEKQNKDNYNISIYFEYLNTGSNVSINPDFKIWPASLTKLPLAMVVMKKVEEGEWNLNDELVLLDDDLDEKSGDLYQQNTVGSRFTVEQLLEKVLVFSDNTAYKILYRNIAESDYQKLISSIGLQELFNVEGKISPKEYSRLLRSLYYSSFLNPENSEKLLGYLQKATFTHYLSKGLPDGVPFAHKYGENLQYNLFSDYGIVYVKNRPYLIAVSIEAKNSSDKDKTIKEADDMMQKISEYIYTYVNSY